jgi:non-specific serine/threonine protein kinase
LLRPEERELFARLSIFAGSWTLEAAEAVADADLDILQSLVEKSLIRHAGERYLMLATIREFASEQTPATDPELHRRHAQFFCDVVLRTDAELRGDHDDVLLDALEKDHDNVRAALTWSIDNGRDLGVRLARGMSRFWWMRGTDAEAIRWLDALLEDPDRLSQSLRAYGLAAYAEIVTNDAAWDVARAKAEEALSIAREVGDLDVAARALDVLGETYGAQGRPADAENAYAEALRIARESGNRYGEATTAYNLGVYHRDQGDFERARALMDQALCLAEQLGAREGVASSRLGIGSLLRKQGDLDASLEMVRRALAEFVALGFPARIAWALIEVAGILGERNDAEVAARLLGASTAIIEASGGYDVDALSTAIEGHLISALGEQRFIELHAEGRALTTDDAVALAGVPTM